MKAPPFDYRRVSSTEEAVAILAEEGEDAKVLAGGQSLVPMLNLRLANPQVLVDVGPLPMRSVEVRGDRIRIGALVTHRVLETDPVVSAELPLVALAATQVGHPAIRNRGTIGGSLAHADPAAELIVVALALDAQILAQSAAGERAIPIADFLDGPYTSSLAVDELVTAVEFPRHGSRALAFEELAIRAGDFAVAAVATVFDQLPDGTLAGVRVALGGVAGTAVRATATESALEGNQVTPEALREAAGRAADGIDPRTDVHGSARYRRALVKTLVERAVLNATDGTMP